MNARRPKWEHLRFTSTAAERRAADQFLAALRGGPALLAPDLGYPSEAPALSSRVGNDTAEQLGLRGARGSLETDEGERGVHLPQLLAHASSGARYDLTGNNCILRWASLPRGHAGAVDVVVHFHGYQGHNAMRLQRKADASGVDLDVAGLTRPTVGVVPHGRAFPARRRCHDGTTLSCPRDTWTARCPDESRPVSCQDGFDFPALESKSELLRFVQAALDDVARERGSNGLTRGRLIITGHSGGGAHLSKLFHAFRESDEVSAFQFFDATYGGQAPITTEGGWLARSLTRDASALAGMGEAEWPRYLQRSGSHLRIAFIAGTGTANVATNVDRFIEAKLRELSVSEPVRRALRRYYRAQSTVGLQHGEIPRALGGRLLVEPGDDCQGLLRDLPVAAPRRGRPRRRPAPSEAALSEQDPPELLEDSEALPAVGGVLQAAPLVLEAADEAAPDEAADDAALSQDEVDRLAAVPIGGAADIHAFFGRGGRPQFAAWYNADLAGKGPFTRRGDAIRMPTSADARRRFDGFWDQLQTTYGRPRITLLDFAAIMCIVLNETGGRFEGFPERCGRGRTDARGPHPGLAYAFDRILEVKRSYNTASSNRTAGALFNDRDFIRAHGELPGGALVAGRGDEWDGAWHGELFPQQAFGTAEDPHVNGALMQADFYKFRGRGVIQTTGRASYVKVIRFIQQYRGASAVIGSYRERWAALSVEVAATVSTTEDWDRLFDDPEILATGPALHGRDGSRDYRIMDLRAEVLNHVSPSTGDTRGTAGSIYALGRRVSGRHRYGAGIYRERVLSLLRAALPLV